jgi:hypothetical protein
MANWEGSTSSKFGKTKKLINFNPSTDTSSQGLYGDIDSGIERIKGKRHYSQLAEQRHYTWRSSIKIPETPHFTPRPAGVRRISPVYLEPRFQVQRKHVMPVRQATVGSNFNDFCEVKYSGSYMMNNRIW